MAQAFSRWNFGGTLGLVGRGAPQSNDGADGWFSSIEAAASALGAIDLAVLSIGTDHVMTALHDCVAAEVAGVIVLANAGGGDDLAGLSDEVIDEVRSSGLRVIGPSSAGLLDPPGGLPASLMRRVTTEPPLTGPGVAILSNSGAFANELLWGLRHQGVGISFWLTLGAEADVTMGDVMDVLRDRDDISAVITLTESMSHGDAYLRGARALTDAGIPVLAYQLLTSENARSVASLHSGTASAPGELWQAAAGAAGVVSCGSMEALAWSAVWLDFCWRRERQHGTSPRRAAVVTISGGGGVVAVDRGAKRGAEFTESFQPKTVKALEALGIPTTNPLDIGATTSRPSLELLRDVTDLVAADENVDSVWLQAPSALYGNEDRTQLMGLLAAGDVVRTKPVMISTIVGWPDEFVAAAGGPVVSVPSVDAGLWALATQSEVARQLARSTARAESSPIEPLPGLDRVESLADGLRLVESWEAVSIPRWWLLSGDDNADVLEHIEGEASFPLVAKADSMGHKARAGQVHVGIASMTELRAIVDAFSQTPNQRVIIQEQVASGAEILIGCISAPDIGEIAVLGTGGVGTDDDPRRVLVYLPSTQSEVAAAVRQFCDERPELTADESSQIQACLSELIARFGGRDDSVAGIEINPVILSAESCWAVDVRIAEGTADDAAP